VKLVISSFVTPNGVVLGLIDVTDHRHHLASLHNPILPRARATTFEKCIWAHTLIFRTCRNGWDVDAKSRRL
jgi:hypothetical protein